MTTVMLAERYNLGDDSWYLQVTRYAAHAPGWLQGFAALATEGALVLLGVLFLVAAWRTRAQAPAIKARVWTVPFAVVIAYLLSELVKSLLTEQRPCRAVPGAIAIDGCPPPNDWALPSNHSVLAAAAATTLIIAWRRCVIPALLLALVVGASRVFLGVHYPHDVLAGYLFGFVVAVALVPLLVRALLPLARRWGGRGDDPHGPGRADPDAPTAHIPR